MHMWQWRVVISPSEMKTFSLEMKNYTVVRTSLSEEQATHVLVCSIRTDFCHVYMYTLSNGYPGSLKVVCYATI